MRTTIPNLTSKDLLKLQKFSNLDYTAEYEIETIKGKHIQYGESRTSSIANVIARAFSFNPDGTIYDYKEFQSKSFVSNFLGYLWEGITAGSINLTDVNNTSRNYNNTYAWIAGGSNYNGVGDYRGISLGTGSTPPSPLDYNLYGLITHGNNSGQLFYLDCIQSVGVSSNYPSTGSTGFTEQRVVINNTSSSITVNEMAIIRYDYLAYNIMTLRDVIPGGLSIPGNGGTALFQYTIYTSLDAIANMSVAIQGFTTRYQSSTLASFDNYGTWTNSTSALYKNTAGGASGYDGNPFGYNAATSAYGPVASSTSGIIFGTGSTTPLVTDYNLTSPIAQGTGTGQLYYQVQTNTSPSVVGQVTSFQISRVAVNQNASPITVTEEGLLVQSYPAYITHSLINGGTGYTLAQNNQLTGYYTFSTTT